MRRYLWSKKRTKNVIVLTVMMTSVIMLVLEYSSEFQLLHSGYFTSEISSLEDIREDLKSISDDNPGFIKYIQNRLVPPALQNSSLRLHKSIHTGQIGQAEEVIKYFKGKSHGIFVEAGAFNGEYLSNTLYLEANHTWTGLLVEPNSAAFKGLVKKNRKCHAAHSCLSVTPHPDIVEFDSADVFGGINMELEDVNNKDLERIRKSVPKKLRTRESVECYPLYSLLLAANIAHKVDLLSLDIEGAELAVLKTMPWDKVNIELIMIEVSHSNQAEIDKTLMSAGYEAYKKLKNQDIIYKKAPMV